ncbi:MAG TPA: hypothetical protein VFD15_00660, partial [Clostridia bacterium]|nr:hypothetical protein [Clostridia bacterium]
MLSRERVSCSIGHQEPDRIPKGEICIDDTVVKETLLCERVGFEERNQFAELLGLDIYCISPTVSQTDGFPAPKAVSFPDLE